MPVARRGVGAHDRRARTPLTLGRGLDRGGCACERHLRGGHPLLPVRHDDADCGREAADDQRRNGVGQQGHADAAGHPRRTRRGEPRLAAEGGGRVQVARVHRGSAGAEHNGVAERSQRARFP